MWTTMPSPVGELRIVAVDGAVRAIEYDGTDVDGHSPRSSTRLAAARSAGRPAGDRCDGDLLLKEVVRQLEAYFDGQLREFDLPVAPDGTAFQQRVWEQLRGIGYGETATYGEIARRLGLTAAASRAVGLANGRNPVPIVIPCHRVVGSGGALTGYAGGLGRKQRLLDLEQGVLF